jgi:hypothetical protein
VRSVAVLLDVVLTFLSSIIVLIPSDNFGVVHLLHLDSIMLIYEGMNKCIVLCF